MQSSVNSLNTSNVEDRTAEESKTPRWKLACQICIAVASVAAIVAFQFIKLGSDSKTPAGSVEADETCKFEQNVGDGICDDLANTEECFYDGGDCCLKNKLTMVCRECRCINSSTTTLKFTFPQTTTVPITTTTTTTTTITTSTTTITTTTKTTINVTTLSETRLLVTSGYQGKHTGGTDLLIYSSTSAATMSELLDLGNSKYHKNTGSCPELHSFTRINYASTSFWLSSSDNGGNGVILVCGGFDFTDTTYGEVSRHCYEYKLVKDGTDEPDNYILMKERRFYHAGIPLDNDKIWITGGLTDYSYVEGQWNKTLARSTEILSLKGSDWGPDLPQPLFGHCLVKIDNAKAMIIGGQEEGDQALSKTWEIGLVDFDFQEKDELLEARSNHACGLIKDSNAGSSGISAIVVTGGCYLCFSYGTKYKDRSSSELWIIDGSDSWIFGPDLPERIFGSRGLSSPDRTSFFLIGGEVWREPGQYEALDSIFKMTCHNFANPGNPDCAWNDFRAMSSKRAEFVALIIPASLDPCL